MNGRQAAREALGLLLGADDGEDQEVEAMIARARVALLAEGLPPALVRAALDSMVASVRGTVRPIADPAVRRAALLALLADRLDNAAERYVREYQASVPRLNEGYALSHKYRGGGYAPPGPKTREAHARGVARFAGQTPGHELPVIPGE